MTIETVEATRPGDNRTRMNNELFGVFGDRSTFERHRPTDEFDDVVGGDAVTVGVRGDELHLRHRYDSFSGQHGCCVVWGEVVPGADFAGPAAGTLPDASTTEPRGDAPTVDSPAETVYEAFAEAGTAAFDGLGGSYLVVVEHDGDAVVAGDLLRSIECFYTDAGGRRTFGTDAARLARTIEDPSIHWRGLNQLLHVGVVFENRTLLRELRRSPFDGYLAASGTGDFERFVYRPRDGADVDHARRLADRLSAAIRRRRIDASPSGILASAGFDSRLLLATIPDLDVSYTLGTQDTPEVRVARTIAEQYGVDHEVLPVTDRYLDMRPEIVQYTHGLRESVHIHHRGNVGQLTEPVMHHGLLLDTLLRDIYLSRRTIDGFGRSLPLPWLESDPDPVEYYDGRLGVYTDREELLGSHPVDGLSSSELFAESIETAMAACLRHSDSTQNAMSRLGVRLSPALPFRTHIADNHLETLVAGDADLIDWHLTTPPAYRNGRTYQRALERIDDDILRHRPPDRPHRSYVLNQIEGFLKRTLPGLSPGGTPWPDRDELYDEIGMDGKLFPDTPAVHELPPRIKLRIGDAMVWLECATGERHSPEQLLRLP